MRTIAAALIAMTMATAVSSEEPKASGPLPDAAKLAVMAARFAPVAIGTDVSKLPAGERQALARLVEAARIMDPLFVRQTRSGSEALLMQLLDDCITS